MRGSSATARVTTAQTIAHARRRPRFVAVEPTDQSIPTVLRLRRMEGGRRRGSFSLTDLEPDGEPTAVGEDPLALPLPPPSGHEETMADGPIPSRPSKRPG